MRLVKGSVPLNTLQSKDICETFTNDLTVTSSPHVRIMLVGNTKAGNGGFCMCGLSKTQYLLKI